jgi:hypothetical protein
LATSIWFSSTLAISVDRSAMSSSERSSKVAIVPGTTVSPTRMLR